MIFLEGSTEYEYVYLQFFCLKIINLEYPIRKKKIILFSKTNLIFEKKIVSTIFSYSVRHCVIRKIPPLQHDRSVDTRLGHLSTTSRRHVQSGISALTHLHPLHTLESQKNKFKFHFSVAIAT